MLYERKDIEAEPLKREIMVHLAMHYKCEVCGTVFRFWLEKGLEDKKQDEMLNILLGKAIFLFMITDH